MNKTNVWLKEIGQTLDCERHRSYQALRAVLHCLCDRLILDEAPYLGDQLPMLVHGICYETWRLSGKPEEECLARIAANPANATIEPEDAARAVHQVLESHISPAQLYVRDALPRDSALWRQLRLGAPAALSSSPGLGAIQARTEIRYVRDT